MRQYGRSSLLHIFVWNEDLFWKKVIKEIVLCSFELYSYYIVKTILWLFPKYSTILWLLLYYGCDIFLRPLLYYGCDIYLRPLSGNSWLKCLLKYLVLHVNCTCTRCEFACVDGISSTNNISTKYLLLKGTIRCTPSKILDDQNFHVNAIRTYSCFCTSANL